MACAWRPASVSRNLPKSRTRATNPHPLLRFAFSGSATTSSPGGYFRASELSFPPTSYCSYRTPILAAGTPKQSIAIADTPSGAICVSDAPGRRKKNLVRSAPCTPSSASQRLTDAYHTDSGTPLAVSRMSTSNPIDDASAATAAWFSITRVPLRDTIPSLGLLLTFVSGTGAGCFAS
nr:unnamed protein product [Digitaria exilis]